MTVSPPRRDDLDDSSAHPIEVGQDQPGGSSISSAQDTAELLLRLRQLAVSSSSEQRFLDMTIRAVCNGLKTPLGKILELDSDEEQLLVRAGIGWRDGVVGYARVATKPTSQAGLTLALREPVMFDDLRGTRRFTDALLLRSHGVVSSLSVAIATDDQLVGVLSVHTLEPRSFSSVEARFLTDVAAIVGDALARRRHTSEEASTHSTTSDSDAD